MRKVTIDRKTYEATHRKGMPAIRQIDKNGNTARWIPLLSDTGRSVMQALNVEPAMAPGFSAE